MDVEGMMLAMENENWHTFDEYETVILTDIAPANVVKDYNDRVRYWIHYLGVDYYVYPQQFYEMRTRIGYTLEKIEEEMKEIYTKEQILEWKKNFKK